MGTLDIGCAAAALAAALGAHAGAHGARSLIAASRLPAAIVVVPIPALASRRVAALERQPRSLGG